jgi:hypothetical protein
VEVAKRVVERDLGYAVGTFKVPCDVVAVLIANRTPTLGELSWWSQIGCFDELKPQSEVTGKR